MPEMELQPPSPLCCLRFNPKSTDILVGGCYNGLVTYFDMRKPGNGHRESRSTTLVCFREAVILYRIREPSAMRFPPLGLSERKGSTVYLCVGVQARRGARPSRRSRR
jgi:hypothetical protein